MYIYIYNPFNLKTPIWFENTILHESGFVCFWRVKFEGTGLVCERLSQRTTRIQESTEAWCGLALPKDHDDIWQNWRWLREQLSLFQREWKHVIQNANGFRKWQTEVAQGLLPLGSWSSASACDAGLTCGFTSRTASWLLYSLIRSFWFKTRVEAPGLCEMADFILCIFTVNINIRICQCLAQSCNLQDTDRTHLQCLGMLKMLKAMQSSHVEPR